MRGIFLNLLQCSLSASAAVILLTLLSRLLRKKTRPKLRLTCWLFVALSLLIPFRPQIFSLPMPSFISSFGESAATRLDGRLNPEGFMDQSNIAEPQPGEQSGSAGAAIANGNAAAEQAETAAAEGKPLDFATVLATVWALGFVIAVAVCILRHILFLRAVKRWGRPVHGEASALMDEIRQELGIKRSFRLLTSPVISVPALAGFFRPAVVLPGEVIGEDKLRFIFLHEALHHKRRDNWIKLFSFLATAVHWFNPFAHLLNRAVITESEAACDLAVLRHAGADKRFQYAETILFTAKSGGHAKSRLASAFNKKGGNLQRRLGSIIETPSSKRWVSAICAAALFIGLLLPMGVSGFQAQADTPEDDLPRLKDLYEDYFLIGASGDLGILESQPYHLLIRQFNSFTFENEMKPQYIQEEEGSFCFARVDEIMDSLRDKDISLVGHTLAWHQQTQSWMWDDADKAQERLEAHIEAVMRHCGPDIAYIDVVNEVFTNSFYIEDWRDSLHGGGWFDVLGEDFIEIAFRKADEMRREIGRPDLKLYYNDYSLHMPGKAHAVYKMVTELRAKGVPIDGIGLQAHFDHSTPVISVRKTLELFNSIPGIEVSVSELDIGMFSSMGNGGLNTQEDALQSKIYAELFALFKEYAAGPANPDETKRLITRVTFWGINDDANWRDGQYPLIFDSEFAPKGAFYAVADPEGFLAELI